VHFEFSHDEEDALAMAMSLSLLDVTTQMPDAAASLPQVSEMTEYDQLTLALTESLAVAPPELKMDQKGAFPTASTDDEDDRKLPAKSVNGSSIGGGEGKNSACEDFNSATYVVSLRDESRSPSSRKPPSHESSFRQLHRQTRGDDPGLTQVPTRTTISTIRSRSMSPALRASMPMDSLPITDSLPGTTSGVIRHSRRSQSPRQGELDSQRGKVAVEKKQSKSVGFHGGSNHRRRKGRITHDEAQLRQEDQMLKEALRLSLHEHTHSLNQF